MAQLACMDIESVQGVVRIMSRLMSDMLRSGSIESVRRIGAWAWGLLGKCREVGEMATEEVGEIRDLGKRAAKILQKIQEAEDMPTKEADISDSDVAEYEPPETLDPEEPGETCLQETADDRDSEMRDATDLSSELEAAKVRLQVQLQDGTEPEAAPGTDEDLKKQTRALLDMIITVVGEFFRQRDLLDAREIWAR